MSAPPSSPRDRLRHLITVPPEQSEHAWPHIWRTLAVTLAGLVAVSLALGLVAALLVAAPHAIATGQLGTPCVSTDTLDCTRALADARQSVLFSAGGLIAIVGLYFTYRRWMLERATTRVAVAEGVLSAERHASEKAQQRTTQLTDALSLLEHERESNRAAAVSLLTEYALNAGETGHDKLILDVLVAHIRTATQATRVTVQGQETDQLVPLRGTDHEVIVAVLKISSARRLIANLTGMVFIDLQAPNTDWTYARLDTTVFSGGNLSGARFGGRDTKLGQYRQLRFVNTNLDTSDFSGAILFGGDFEVSESYAGYRKDFANALFVDTKVVSVRFGNRVLKNPNFDQALLHDVRFGKATLDGGSFVGSVMLEADFTEAKVVGQIDVTDADITDTFFGDLISDGKVIGISESSVVEPHGRVLLRPSLRPATPAASSAPARDSGQTAGDSRTPEPSPTDESPT